MKVSKKTRKWAKSIGLKKFKTYSELQSLFYKHYGIWIIVYDNGDFYYWRCRALKAESLIKCNTPDKALKRAFKSKFITKSVKK